MTQPDIPFWRYDLLYEVAWSAGFSNQAPWKSLSKDNLRPGNNVLDFRPSCGAVLLAVAPPEEGFEYPGQAKQSAAVEFTLVFAWLAAAGIVVG